MQVSVPILVFGIIILIAGIRGRADTLGTTLSNQLTGDKSFVYWLAAVVILALIAQSDTFSPIASGILTVALITYVIKDGGVFDNFVKALNA